VFVRDTLTPVLPSEEAVCHYHRLLLDYARGEAPLFVVRHVTGMERGTEVITSDGTRLLPSDNAPAWYLHAVAFNGVLVEQEDFTEFVAGMPTHFFKVSKYPTANTAGWHVAHILEAKDGNTAWKSWDHNGAVRRFIRNVHPLNIFFVSKTDWQRVGGDPDLIGYIAHVYKERYGQVWNEFVEIAGGGDLQQCPDAAGNRISIDADASQGGGSPRTRDRSSWAFVLGSRKTPPIAEILARHPEATERTARLVAGLDLPGFVALGDTLHNKCRPSELKKAVPGLPRRQAALAWDRLEAGATKRYVRPSGWTGAIKLLAEGADVGLAEVRSMDITKLAAAALRVVDGPYREANKRGIR